MNPRETTLLRSVLETTWRYYAWVVFLMVVLLWGLYAYVHQLRQGLIVTGLRDQVSWGLYITNFVFFIGISHAGTLLSAILRVTETDWRRPITRMAEAITVFALCIGGPMVIIDLGRPDRMHHLLIHGRIQSPIIWDVLSVSTYLAGCILYFYLPVIPDMALLAAQPGLAPWRRWLYQKLALGWTGSEPQKHLLERAIAVMAVVIIPLAVSVHTVVSWIFAMTLRPGWDSSIFGPYFVVGAIYSGAAGVIFSMYVLRRIFHLEEYVEPLHFRNMGLLLLAFALLYLYFNINEYLTVGYKLEGVERELLHSLFAGDYAWAFWSVQATGVFIPILLMLPVLTWERYRPFTIPAVVLAAFLVVVGAWVKRYLIIVPTLQNPYLPAQNLPQQWMQYRPTWVEWSITAAGLAGFLLIYSLLVKLFPIVSIWETREAGAEIPAKIEQALRWWKPGGATTTGAVLAVALLAGLTTNAHAAPVGKQPKPSQLTVEWEPVASKNPPNPAVAGSESGLRQGYWYAGRLPDPFRFMRSAPEEQESLIPPFAVTATLRDAAGQPIGFKTVEFVLSTSFGKLSFGTRPTSAEGKAKLLIRDRRYGGYPLAVRFQGDQEFAPAEMVVPIAFATRPAPALPKVGVLITPYATSSVGVPFLLFYGFMWVVFAYVLGYLILFRMRRAGTPSTNEYPKSAATPSTTEYPKSASTPPRIPGEETEI